MKFLSISMLYAFLAVIGLAVADDDDEILIGCGSAIKLSHVESGGKNFLNSAGMSLGSGSGQQIVTVIPDRTKTSAMWIIKEENDAKEICQSGDRIACGSKIRLTHKDTGKNLHSHSIRSPLSNQQEVSAYGSDGKGDEGDDWLVVCKKPSTKYLQRRERFYLQHSQTQRFLGATSQVRFTQQNCGGRCPVLNHLEVFCRSRSDEMTEWFIDVGVFLSQ